MKSLGSESDSIRYGTGSPPTYVESGIAFIRATNIKNGTVQPNELKYISKEEADRLERCRIRFGDLIIVRSGVNAGDCALVPPTYDGACAAYDLIVRLTFEKAVFFNFLINSPYGKQMLAPLTRRAAQPHLNADQIRSLLFIAPNPPALKRFANQMAVLAGIRLKHHAHLARLDVLFASLQHCAFSGELTASAATEAA